MTQPIREQSDESKEDAQPNKQSYDQFSIIPQNSPSQILQINFEPGYKFKYNGQIVYSNLPFDEPKDTIFEFRFNKKKSIIWNEFTNKSNAFGIVGLIGKDLGGKIIVLVEDTYQDRFYCSNKNLILVLEDNSLKSHPVLENLCQYSAKNETGSFENIYCLQTQQGGAILEKYLGVREPFYLSKQSILAISKTIQVKKNHNSVYELTGPGWIFFDPVYHKTKKVTNNKSRLLVLIISILFLMMTINIIDF